LFGLRLGNGLVAIGVGFLLHQIRVGLCLQDPCVRLGSCDRFREVGFRLCLCNRAFGIVVRPFFGDVERGPCLCNLGVGVLLCGVRFGVGIILDLLRLCGCTRLFLIRVVSDLFQMR